MEDEKTKGAEIFERLPVKSANITWAAYDSANKVLRIEYGAAVYQHLEVPVALAREFRDLAHSETGSSATKFVREKIEPEYPGVRCGSSGMPVHGGEVWKALRTAQAAMRSSKGEFLYTLWLCCGRPVTVEPVTKQAKLFTTAKLIVAEASGMNVLGAEHLEAGVALALKRGL